LLMQKSKKAKRKNRTLMIHSTNQAALRGLLPNL
jgi:hypothetical protein